MNETKKILAMIIYIVLSLCMGLSRWYVIQNDIEVPSYVKLYSYGASIFPFLLYKLNFKTKWFFYIFVQLFSLLYVYIFEGKNTTYFFISLIDFSDLILRYNLYWKYIVYNTLTLEETKTFHMYASASYIAYHIDSQLEKWIPSYFHGDILIYTCCIVYMCIGIIVYYMYDVEEKHILMYDKVSKKRALFKSLIIYTSSCNFLLIVSNYNTSYTHYATLIASCIILTFNGKLLQYFDYTKLNHIGALMTLLCYVLIKTVHYNYILSIALQVVIGTKFIVFDSVHQILHITHKKNIIDKYIGLEIICMSCAYVTVYYLVDAFEIYVFIALTMIQLFSEHYIKKYYIKDVDFLNCISQLESF